MKTSPSEPQPPQDTPVGTNRVFLPVPYSALELRILAQMGESMCLDPHEVVRKALRRP